MLDGGVIGGWRRRRSDSPKRTRSPHANHYATNSIDHTPARPRSPHQLVGLSRFELLTPRLSSVCSNQLSYRPQQPWIEPLPSKLDRTCAHHQPGTRSISSAEIVARSNRPYGDHRCSRKEVIQPQVLLQLPCYDFTPITNHTLGAYFPCGFARRLLVQPAFVM